MTEPNLRPAPRPGCPSGLALPILAFAPVKPASGLVSIGERLSLCVCGLPYAGIGFTL